MFEKTKAFCDSFLDMGVPGFDLAVYKGGECVLRYMNGYSDLENKVKMNGKERYNIYSCSKVITCTAALQLWEKGLFSLEDKLSDYMPEFKEMTVRTDDGIKKAENPILWNAEKPYLYDVILEREGEEIALKTGLRKVEISDKFELLINGMSVTLHGVNHHDTSKYRGWCQTDEELRKDLELMKDLNMNCVRTSHYPPTPKFIEMCDEIGLYVVCETDIETHGILRRYPNVAYQFDVDSMDWPGTNPIWEKEHIELLEQIALGEFEVLHYAAMVEMRKK